MRVHSKTMRRIIIAIVSLLLCFVICFSLTACGTEGQQGPQGDPGTNGTNGTNGVTPHIGANGNWWIGDTDTGVKASGTTAPEEVKKIAESFTKLDTDPSGLLSANGKFYADYNNLYEAQAASRAVAMKIAAEGMILLKNENNALPMSETETDVTLLGLCSARDVVGGGGAGSGIPGIYGIPATSIKQGVELGGFRVNPDVHKFYMDKYSSNHGTSSALIEEDVDALKANESTFARYNDAAIITIGRTGREGSDVSLYNTNIGGTAVENAHYLELTPGEKELIKYAKAKFPKVVVLINSGNTLEMGELNAPKTNDNLGVDAVLWIGHTSNDAATAIGPILRGTINPSGRTVDTWYADFTKDPTWFNFGTMAHLKDEDGNRYDDDMRRDNGDGTLTTFTSFPVVEYREGIYMGYKYYETKWADMNATTAGSGDTWYEEQMVYPFGYGQSYTTFDWELDASVEETAKISAANQTVTMKVKVTNTGLMAGKDVVQIYVTPPYTSGGIEKAHVNLMAYTKTKLLQPGESQVVTAKFVAQDVASFDWNDANGNDFYGFELEAGDYIVGAYRDSHTLECSVTRTIEETIKCATDYTTGNEITPVFSQAEGKWAEFRSVNDALVRNSMTRSDGLTVAAPSTIADRTVTQSVIDQIEDRAVTRSYEDKETDYWYVNDVPDAWDQSDAQITIVEEPGNAETRHRNTVYYAKRTDGSKTDIQLKDMIGVPYTDYKLDDGDVTVGDDAGSLKWEEFMNQLTWEEMVQIVQHGSYNRLPVESIGMTLQNDHDGPTQIGWFVTNNSYKDWMGTTAGVTTCFPPAVTLAATWDQELAYEFGRAMGNEALFLNVQGWYGPSMNTHRSPFGGRNFEYYSEDGVLAGKIAANVTLGAVEKGMITYIKHLFLNEQETSRSSVVTWCNEQALREIYLKPFEIAIKEGRSTGIMNSMNRIGTVKVYANGALHDGILHDEWNFKGITLTDAYNNTAYAEVNALVRNGVDLPLGTTHVASRGLEINRFDHATNMVYVHPDGLAANTAASAYTAADLTLATPTLYYHVRRAARHILYATANSNGMRNGFLDINVEQTLTVDKTGGRIQIAGFNLSEVYIKEGVLPDGFSLSETGAIYGETLETGTFKLKIGCIVDNWIGQTYYYEYAPTNVAGVFGDAVYFDLTLIVNKKAGYSTGTPVANTSATTSTTVGVNAITVYSGQDVEYGISTTNSASNAVWQDSPTFTGLTPNTQYRIFARTKENAVYAQGSASSARSITTTAA